MGYATATFTVLEQLIWGGNRANIVRVSCTSYGTDGIQMSARDCGLATLTVAIIFFVGAGFVANGPVIGWWDKTNSVIILEKASNAGVDASTNITTAGYIDVLAIGQ